MEHVQVRQEGRVLHITLNRPEKLNAFYGTMREDLLARLTEAEGDASVGAIVLTGSGRGFCGGGDVRYMSEIHRTSNLAEFSRILDAANAATKKLHEYGKPTIAAVNGPAAGGGANLAFACDIRIGSTACNFTESFINIGLGPDWGGSYVLPRIVGADRARELLLTGRTVDAEEALTLGLVHRLVEPKELDQTVAELAAKLAAFSPLAIEAVKAAVRDAPRASLGAALEHERSAQIRCFLSDAAGAAFDAFARRRKKKGA
ncbi:MAG: enoyl-CoA hydratase/isomerase family protein [Planctomycetota bacterium]|jgi:2-(1,2-epoxy-1,2-dihydrophenyl)acetyl-CoA isomerase